MSRHPVEAVVPQGLATALHHFLQPIVVERNIGEILADAAESVHVAMTRLVPIDELYAELEGALRLAQEIVLVDAQQIIVQRYRRDGRLADPDDADLVRLHQRDGETRTHDLGDRCSRHPPGGATAGDNDRLELLGVQGSSLLTRIHSPARAPASVRGFALRAG